jgi:hypothetical protein
LVSLRSVANSVADAPAAPTAPQPVDDKFDVVIRQNELGGGVSVKIKATATADLINATTKSFTEAQKATAEGVLALNRARMTSAAMLAAPILFAGIVGLVA